MPTQASGLLDTLKRVQLTGHQHDGAVEIFHLRWPGIDVTLLNSSLESGRAGREVDEREVASGLKFNKSGKPISSLQDRQHCELCDPEGRKARVEDERPIPRTGH